jgi:hypothetical protein
LSTPILCDQYQKQESQNTENTHCDTSQTLLHQFLAVLAQTLGTGVEAYDVSTHISACLAEFSFDCLFHSVLSPLFLYLHYSTWLIVCQYLFIKKVGEFLPRFLSLAPDQLTVLSGSPSVDALLIHDFANFQSILLGGDSLAYVDVVDAFAVPDADVASSADSMVEDFADLFGSLYFDAHDADLPASLVFHDFAVAESQTFVVLDVADRADIDSSIGSILHNFYLLLFSFFLSLL